MVATLFAKADVRVRVGETSVLWHSTLVYSQMFAVMSFVFFNSGLYTFSPMVIMNWL